MKLPDWVWKILAAISRFFAGLFERKAGDEDSEEASDKIDEADDHITDDDPEPGDEDDFFDNDDWNTPNRPSGPVPGSSNRY